MATELTDELVRKNEANFRLLDDRNVTGGYHTVGLQSDMLAIQTALRKEGMLCYVANRGDNQPQTYQLAPDLVTWNVYTGGSGGDLPMPGVDGAVLISQSNAWEVRQLTQDDIQPGFSIAGFAGGGSYVSVKELGDTLVNPSFTASYSRLPQTVTIDDGSGPISLSSPFTSFAYSGGHAKSYTKTTINDFVNWLLTAVQGTSKTANVRTTWEPRAFFDAAIPGTFNAAFISALTGQALEGSFGRTIAFGNPGGTKKLYYAFPTAFGAPTHFIDTSTGFDFGFVKVASAVSVTNGFGIVTTYDVWASVNFVNNPTTIAVS